MKTVDIGAIFVTYNLIIGILLILASDKIGMLAGKAGYRFQPQVTRYTRTAVRAFGWTAAMLCASLEVVHLLAA